MKRQLHGAGASPIAFDLGPIEVGKARRTGEIASLSAKPLQLSACFLQRDASTLGLLIDIHWHLVCPCHIEHSKCRWRSLGSEEDIAAG